LQQEERPKGRLQKELQNRLQKKNFMASQNAVTSISRNIRSCSRQVGVSVQTARVSNTCASVANATPEEGMSVAISAAIAAATQTAAAAAAAPKTTRAITAVAAKEKAAGNQGEAAEAGSSRVLRSAALHRANQAKEDNDAGRKPALRQNQQQPQPQQQTGAKFDVADAASLGDADHNQGSTLSVQCPEQRLIAIPSSTGGLVAEGRAPVLEFCVSPRVEMRCYEVLGLMRTAGAVDVRHAYRRKALQVHPDKGGGTRAFISVAEAFETLSDIGSREAYDRELALFDSSDGLVDSSGVRTTAAPCVTIQDLVTMVYVLCEMQPADWPQHIAEMPTSSLEEMCSLIINPSRLSPGSGRDPGDTGATDGADQANAQLTCLFYEGRKGSWYVSITMGGLTIRSRNIRCSATVAQWHISVVTLKELFTAHRRANMDSSLEEACKAAFGQARLQKIYFPGEQFSFYFRLGRCQDGPWRNLPTPYVHSVELALEHRRQILGSMEGGQQVTKRLKNRLKTTSNAAKSQYQNDMHGMQRELLGYIRCELRYRKGVKILPGKRFRLRWKQPVSPPIHQMVLPWLEGLVGGKTKNKGAVRMDCVPF